MKSSDFKAFWQAQTQPLHAHAEDQWFDRYAFEIKQYLPSEGIVVDAGCGSGEILMRLSPYYKKMIGIDYSDSMLERAKQRNYSNPVDFFGSSVVKIKSICPSLVDAIYCNGVVQYLSHQELSQFIADSLSILPTGGSLVILQVPNVNCRTLFRLGFYRHESKVSFVRILKGIVSLFFYDLLQFVRSGSTYVDDGIGNWFSIEEMRLMAKRAGGHAEIYGSNSVNYYYRFHVVISKN
jgi:ubiquinone/menaquinone biosynthesis C-methylase UbiE